MSLEGSGLFKLRGRAGSAGLIAKHGVKSAANRGLCVIHNWKGTCLPMATLTCFSNRNCLFRGFLCNCRSESRYVKFIAMTLQIQVLILSFHSSENF